MAVKKISLTTNPLTNSASALAIEALRVERDRVVATVRVANPRRAVTGPALAARALAIHPDLAIHSCVNGMGPTFGAVIEHTAIPHLLEHLVIDLQSQSCPNPDRVFTGATRWTDRAAGLARVEVSYADDMVALQAFRDAARLLDGWMSGGQFGRNE